jgi:hypothetical protein
MQPHLPPTSLYNSIFGIESIQPPHQMPRTCVHRKHDGSSGQTLKHYSVLQKCQVVKYALDQNTQFGTLFRSISLEVQVPTNVLTRWCLQQVQLSEKAKINSKSLSLCAGPVGQLDAVQDQLHTWLFEKREQGMAISITHVVWKAQKFFGPVFTDKSFNAKFLATQRWLRKFAYVYRMPPTRQHERLRSLPGRRWHFYWQLVRRLSVRTTINGTFSIWTKRLCGFCTTTQRLCRRRAQKPSTCGSRQTTREERLLLSPAPLLAISCAR